jgi:hypothetical protein
MEGVVFVVWGEDEGPNVLVFGVTRVRVKARG